MPQAALIIWIISSVALFAFLRPTRAFLLTYVIGILLLPVEKSNNAGFIGSIVFTQSIRIDKFTACHLGAIIGTLAFAPHVLRRFRFHWVDLAFLGVCAGLFVTSMTTGQGPKDGLAVSVENLRLYFPLILLSRLYLTTVGEVYEAMRVIVGAAVCYSLICVGEFRLSPQAHRLVYGYFQHDFGQFARYGHFRPVGFLRHAIELSFFMGSSGAMALWLWYKGLLKRPLWGFLPDWAVLGAIFVGLAATLTFSGYSAFLIACSVFALFHFFRSRWLLWLLPAVACIWMTGRYLNVIDASRLLSLATTVDVSRGESLDYRLRSERNHLDAVKDHVLFGEGPHQNVVNDEGFGMAVDAWWMIQISFYGLVGLGGWYLVWCSGIWTAFRRWRFLTPDLRTTAIAISVLLGIQFIDFLFNSFPSMFLLMLDMGLLTAARNFKPARQRRPAYGFPVDAHQQPLPAGAQHTPVVPVRPAEAAV
jgi:hypothetical protein